MNMTNAALQVVELKDYFFAYQQIAQNFMKQWSIKTILVDPSGSCVLDESDSGAALDKDRQQALDEALRWGDFSTFASTVNANIIIFAVPLMFNSSLIGGIVVEYDIEKDSDRIDSSAISHAMISLMDMVRKCNLINQAYMDKNKKSAAYEAAKATAIHESVGFNYKSLRDVYLVQEPNLITSIKRGDRAAAVEILNSILSNIYFLAGDRKDLLKSFLLELIVSMSRTAVEAGADGNLIMGSNYSSFTELAGLDDEADLTEWVVRMLDTCIDALNKNRLYPNSVLISEALNYMKKNIKKNMTRDEIAAVACLSPSHFSRIIRNTFGQSFTEIVSKFRVDKAKELLLYTNMGLSEVATECGFNDQSYFTKVFLKIVRQTPGEYRRSKQNAQNMLLRSTVYQDISDKINNK